MAFSSRNNLATASPSPEPTLPAWYYRLLRITIEEDRPIDPEDFDEDISDLEESSEDERSDCGSVGSECLGDLDDDDDDNMSVRTFTGSEADFYYELRPEREERKRFLRDVRLANQPLKEEEREFERILVNGTQKAEERLEEAILQGQEPPELNFYNHSVFNMFSVDYQEYIDSIQDREQRDDFRDPQVEFHKPDLPSDLTGHGARKWTAHIHFSSGSGANIDIFSLPKCVDLEDRLLETQYRTFNIEFRFINEDYLFITVPWELIFGPTDELSPPRNRRPESAPEFFTFACVNETCDPPETRREKASSRLLIKQWEKEYDVEEDNKWLPQYAHWPPSWTC
ncbi:hypothetical protein FDECE_12811 [Fusarium decemcellulare]|nr:hypothetical protein FDECE_12811 [Fusarium decemcellulare]